MPSSDSEKDAGGFGYLAIFWRHLQDALAGRFSSDKTEKRDRSVLLLITSLMLTVFIAPDQLILSSRYKAGEIAVSDIRASRDYLVEDRKLTEEKQVEAEAAVQMVYELDPGMVDGLVQRLGKSISSLKTGIKVETPSGQEALRGSVSQLLGVEVAAPEIAALARIIHEKQFLAESRRLFSRIYRNIIIADQRTFVSDRLNGIVLLGVNGEPLPESSLQLEHMEVDEARRLLSEMKLSTAGEGESAVILKGLLAKMLRPSLAYSKVKTEEKKEAARRAVSPVLIQIKRGEMIVRDGDRITPEQELKLDGIIKDRPVVNRIFSLFGVMGIILVLLYFPYRFARKNIRKFNPSNKDIALLAILTVTHFLLLRIFSSISAVLGGAFPNVVTESYYYLFPFAATAIIVRIIINSEVALVYAAICAPLAGLMYGSLPVVFYSLLGSIIGAHGVRHCDNRGIIFTAGLKVSVVNLAMALSFQLFSEAIFTSQTIYCILFALASGLINSILVSGGIPLIESLFQYTTDIKLLELTNLNSPVLRDLMVRAPGTYHHSVMVGNMVEAAAEAINANPLLARVSAYYHDIGKISKAQYFIENQQGGENKHDRLSPHMSALILISHVKEGAELARQHRLGQPIVEIIRQSHGTALIKYFYQRAIEQSVPGQTVDEREFRYPGPKPQTREAGLVLLADCVEAASRTLADPTPARIQGMVQKIINNIFIDGQLDECELTLKNLHEIAWSFNRILSGIYHHRIDYPQPAYKEKSFSGRKQGEHSDNEPAAAMENGYEVAKGGSGEDLRRLGMHH